MTLPIDLPSALIGAGLALLIRWLATHVDEWFDDGTEDDQC